MNSPAGTVGVRLRGTRGGLVLGLSMLAVLSQFYRSSIAVVAPELVRDLSLTPQALGLAGGVFFLALGIVQVPVGMAFDRVGPRLTVASISALALAGALVLAFAADGTDLIAGRFLLGAGCGASFMSAVVMLVRWYPRERIGTMVARIFAFSQVGNFAAATPMAWLTETVGWRAVFGASAVVSAAVVAFFVWAARDQPPGQAPVRVAAEPLARTLRGFGEVLRTKDYKRVIAIHAVAYASVATVLGLWSGPYLHDAFGLDGVGRGHVLLATSAAQVAGLLWLVPLERRLNSRKIVIVAGALAVAAILLALAILPAPPVALAIALLVVLAGVGTYSPIIIAHATSLVPPTLQGRGSATANIGQVAGAFLLPVATGAIAGCFESTSGGYPLVAYRLIFAALAIALVAGIAVYLGARDARPRPDGPPTGTRSP